MTVQTTYLIDKVLGYPGDVADCADTVKDTKISKFAGQIGFGLFLTKRAAQADGVEDCGPPTATADVTARPRGFSVRNQLTKPGGYELNEPVTLLRKGVIWVQVEAAVAQDGQVFARFAAGAGGSVLGSIRGDADTATAVAIPGAVFRSSTSGAGLAKVEINMP
jgi:hypothetical protein